MLKVRIKTTALVLTYNQEDCIEEAIRSVVGQTVQPDEILVSDDCSTDATYERAQNVVHELVRAGTFKGSFRLNKNKENLGFIPHFNWAIQECSGEFILYNAGDDTSMPDRLETFVKAYERRGSPKFFLGHSSVQIKGGPQDGGVWVPPIEQAKFPIERLANSSALHIGAAQCFTKSLFDDFGPIRFSDAYEDLILGFRALLTDAYWYSQVPLLIYRVGGLTFWQKNTWEKKRQRYEAVLSQRSLDALKHGRPDLAKEIALAYQDYGFSLLPHPDRIYVYSHQDTEASLFDYSIEEHFHRLPHLIERRPLEEFFSEHIRGTKAFSKERTLVFLRVSLLGWERVISYLEQLNDRGASVVVDCGISIINLNELESNVDYRNQIKDFYSKNETFKVTSACPVIGVRLKDIFNGAFVPSALIMDVDGARPQRSRRPTGDPVRVLLVCSPHMGLSGKFPNIARDLLDLQVLHKANSCHLFIPSVCLKALGGEVISSFSYGHQMHELKECRRNQGEFFDHILLIKDFGDHKLGAFLNGIFWRAITNFIPVSVAGTSVSQTCVMETYNEKERAALYFNNSIQKQVNEVTLFLNGLLFDPEKFKRLNPL